VLFVDVVVVTVMILVSQHVILQLYLYINICHFTQNAVSLSIGLTSWTLD